MTKKEKPMPNKDCQIRLPQSAVIKLGSRDYVIIQASLLNNQIRNQCWNCSRFFIIHDPKYYMELEEGQKVYLKCNHCGKVNHL